MQEIILKLACLGLGLGTVYLTTTKIAAALRTGIFPARRSDYHRADNPLLFWGSIVGSVMFMALGFFLAWAGWRWPERVF